MDNTRNYGYLPKVADTTGENHVGHQPHQDVHSTPTELHNVYHKKCLCIPRRTMLWALGIFLIYEFYFILWVFIILVQRFLFWCNPKSAIYYLQQMTIANFAAFSKITNKVWYFMRIVCWQRFSCNIIPYFCQKLGKMSQNLSSAAVVIGALRVRVNTVRWPEQYPCTKNTIHCTYILPHRTATSSAHVGAPHNGQ